MLFNNVNIETVWLVNQNTGKKYALSGLSEIELESTSGIGEEDNSRAIYYYNEEYWNAAKTFTFEDVYIDSSVILTNNWRKQHGKNMLPYRKLFNHNKKYALTIYNKKRKYIRDRYTFDEWKEKRGITDD